MANLCPGYIGMLEVDSTLIRCTDFNVNPSQDFLFYDHVIGLNDTVPIDNSTKGEEVGAIQTQKRIGRPSTISIGGGFSFPATGSQGSNNFEKLFEHAKLGDYFDLDFQYHRGSDQTARRFIDCRVNQFTFSITAGDILSISVDVLSKNMEESGGVTNYIEAEKMITWDKVTVSAGGVTSDSGIQGLEFSINNNLKNIYTVDPEPDNKFLPKDLRVGMQEVEGNISVYNIPGKSFITTITGITEISVAAPGWSTPINSILKPQEVAGTLGPIISSVPFVGVDKAFGN